MIFAISSSDRVPAALTDTLLALRFHVASEDVYDAIGIDFKRNFDLGRSRLRLGNISKYELTEQVVLVGLIVLSL